MLKYSFRLLVVFLCLLMACDQNRSSDKKDTEDSGKYKLTSIRYAKNFSIQYEKNYKILKVLHPDRPNELIASYLLKRKNTAITTGEKFNFQIELPVKTLACFSTTDLPFIEMLGLESKLVGAPLQKYIYSKKINQLINQGKVKVVGGETGIDLELLVQLKPTMVITTTPFSAEHSQDKLSELGLKAVLNSSYLENHPLGRAEWIKFVAAFFDLEHQANGYFDEIEQKYLALKKLTENLDNKPKVLLNIPFKELWYVPGGRNYMAVYLRDAGAAYYWIEEKQAQSLTRDFEAVYAKANDCDFWINTGDVLSKDQLLRKDSRFADFAAFKKGQLYSHLLRKNTHHFFDFYESGIVNPHLVLADLIKIFHPELLPSHQFYYYQQLD